MKRKSYDFFASSPERMQTLVAVVEYATAEVTDPARFARIESLAAAHKDEPRFSHKRSFQDPSFPSKSLFYTYYFTEGKLPAGGSLLETVVDAAFELLVDKFILTEDWTPKQYGPEQDQEYLLNEGLTKFLHARDAVFNALFGFRGAIDRYQNSVVKIEVQDAIGDWSMGNGWYLDMATADGSQPACRFVVTNDHVLAGAVRFRVKSRDDQVIPHYDFELFEANHRVDIALIRVEFDEQIPALSLGIPPSVLDEIITIGYPAIPRSQDSYQVVHRGEVNSIVKEYSGQDLMIISARTSPGHSGSPVLDESGLVVGMVTQLLYEKAFQEKGISPYFACLPGRAIYDALSPEKSALVRNNTLVKGGASPEAILPTDPATASTYGTPADSDA